MIENIPKTEGRVRIGCCGSMLAPAEDPIGIEGIEVMADLGFDYIELSLAHLAALDGDRYGQLAKRVESSGLCCEACNNFFPSSIRLTGAHARLDAALAYARGAMDRAAGLGACVLVFGSSGAKNVPAGFDHQIAWQQIVELLQHLGSEAQSRQMTIAIEPLNRLESNIVNLAAEGLRLASEVAHPNVGLLIDFYHLATEGEDLTILSEARAIIRHLHVARVAGRRFPCQQESATMGAFFSGIRKIGYSGRCSIEAYTDDFRTDSQCALAYLRSALNLKIEESSP